MQQLSREHRRKIKRDIDKNIKMINKLTPAQAQLIERVSEQRTNERIEEVNAIFDTCLKALLIHLNPTKDLKYIENIEDKFVELCVEHARKLNELIRGENEEMATKKVESLKKQLEVKARELIDLKITQKESIERMKEVFPQASTSMIANVYKEMKAINNPEENLEDAVDYIFGGNAADTKENNEIVEAVRESIKEAVKPLSGQPNIKENKGNIIEEIKEHLKNDDGIKKAIKNNITVVNNIDDGYRKIENIEAVYYKPISEESNLKVVRKKLDIIGRFGSYEVEDNEVKVITKALYGNDVDVYKDVETVREHKSQHLALIKNYYDELEEVFTFI